MLNSIRNFSKTITAKIFLFIVAVPFVFWGMGDVFTSGNTNSLAKINNENISTEDFIDHINKLNINQNLINDFANLTMDNQFIHIDPERALKETPFGSTIAHGFLILSLSTKLFVDVIGEIEGEKMGINYGFNKLRFINPVKSNDMIRP